MIWRMWIRLRRSVFRRAQDDRDLDEELRFHIAQEIRLRIDRGASPEDAERAARIAMGSVALTQESTRAVWVSPRLEQLVQDLRAGSRIVTGSPGVTAAAVILIALVIGVNTTIFSVIHSILHKPAPGVQSSDLVTLTWIARDDWIEPETSYANYLDLAAQSVTARLAGSFPQRLTLSDENGSHALWGAQVSPNYFDVLGVTLAAGRPFTADEHTSAASGLVAIISHAAWQAYFGGRSDVAGISILLDGQPATIVGVSAPPFRGSFLAPAVDVWVPFVSFARAVGRAGALIDRQGRGPNVVGQLQEGHSIRSAQAELTRLWTQLKGEHHEMRQDFELTVMPHSGTAGGNGAIATQGPTFLAIFSVLTLITLLIVCANVANLLIGRAIARQREMALRQSLGASRVRIVRLLLTEGMVVASLAWGVACLFAWWVSKLLLPVVAPDEPAVMHLDVAPDWTVIGYALLLAAVGMIAVTVGPALRVWHQPLLPWLKAGEQGIAQGRSRLSSGLVVLQLALSVLLLVTAGLAYRSVSLLGNLELGYQTEGLLLATVRTSGFVDDARARMALLERLRERLATVPGVDAVSYARAAPSAFWSTDRVHTPDITQPLTTEVNRVGPGYLEVFGLSALAGIDMRSDHMGAGSWAIVNQGLAESLWPGQPPVGRSITLEASKRTAEVIGVAPDVFFGGYRRVTQPRIVLFADVDLRDQFLETTFYIRHTPALDTMIPAIHREVRQTDPRLPVVAIRSFDAQLSGIIWPIRLVATLLTVFGAGCLVIAAVGQYAAVSFDMRRRVREIGIRLALGASRRQVLVTVFGAGFTSTAAGLVIGFLISAGVATALGSVLYGVTPTDAVTYLGVFALLTLASLTACALPARRAARIDPVKALRYE